jgi:glycosyltransferase involved in cell wall biosynthesis
MKLALVADWLPTYGGAERVISALHELWPDAPIHTTVAAPEKLPKALASADIRTSKSLQTLFRITGKHQVLLPWMPRAMEKIDCTGSDVIFSSSHAVGKGVIPPATSKHICYCHTPMRYAWEMENEYLKDFGVRWPLKRFVKKELKRLRRWDLSTAKRVDSFIANSTETQKRIKRIYGRESVVIPPPVGANFFTHPLSKEKGEYFLALGRMVPYKRFDLLIELANTLKLPLKIGGMGGEMQKLKAMAGDTVEFLGFVPDEALPKLYSNAKALLFPQMEDAGIVPMEAQASGTPVIAFGAGGVLDVVKEGVTGILADTQTIESFEQAVKKFQSTTFHRAAIRKHAEQFHETEFKRRIAEEVKNSFGKK